VRVPAAALSRSPRVRGFEKLRREPCHYKARWGGSGQPAHRGTDRAAGMFFS